MNYPLSVLDGKADVAFKTVLLFHLPAGAVLDVTYGTGLSWGEPGLLDGDWEVTRSDLKTGQDIFAARADRPDWRAAFDVLYYDPPWFVDIKARSDDEREAAYGGYGTQSHTLEKFMSFVAEAPWFLKPAGKLILKCSDQYHVPTRRVLMHHLDWCERIAGAGFRIVDFYVYRYHRVSPTAYQVKDRPAAVIAHSYFIVGQAP